MKNKRIVDSWNKIEPDATAEARMLDSILAHTHSGEAEEGKVITMNKVFNWKRLAPIAACLVLVIALLGVFGNNAGWFGGKTLVADLGNGNTLSFYKFNAVGGEASFAWDNDWGEQISRDLTDDEKNMLFGNIEFSYGGTTFRSIDGAFMHYEGKTTDDIHIILSANGHPVTDTPVNGNEEVSEINGIQVTAGYFVTDANSKGIKTIIYFAFFEANGTTVYVELAGDEADSEALRVEIGNLINVLTLNPPDTSELKAD